MKKLLIATSVLAALTSGVALFAQSNNTAICHVTGSGVNLLHISAKAVKGHLGHGDFFPQFVEDSKQGEELTCDIIPQW